MKKRFFLILFLFLNCTICFCQNKIESEKRVKEEVVNPDALSLIQTSFPNAKYKWFLEHSELGEYYECKFKANEYYSIKFTLDGQLVDVELEKDKAYLPKEALNAISYALEMDSTTDNRYRINKIQEQWTGKKDLLESAVRENQFITGLQLAIEIEIVIKQKGEIVYEEWLLNYKGEVINRRKILKPKLDNLIY